jgi:hypothetical protein
LGGDILGRHGGRRQRERQSDTDSRHAQRSSRTLPSHVHCFSL